jgi:hypothetical protein
MSGGFRNLMWYVGVVEDRHDATNDGRIKVRAFGIHTEDKQAMPTADLPWAIVLDGSYGAAQKIPDVGDWVFGFFMDGDDAQHPMVMGRIPGINLQLPPEAGAPKEANYAPVESIPKIGVPPLHRHLGGEHAEKGQGPLQAAAVKNGIETATGETWSEPPIISPEKNLDNTIYTSKNDNNYVVLSDSREGDGTYILISHASGSAVQIDSHGTILVKSFGDTYNSSEGFTMNRTELDSHTNVGGDWSVKVERGSGKIWINGDLDIECENFNVTARGSANINAAAGTNISGGKVGLFATSDDINLAANANIKMKAGTLLNGGGIYGQALFGDVHFDSYKMNLYSTSYMKLTALGTPAVSTQTVPYADATQKGIEINSAVLVNITAPSVAMTGAQAIVSGTVKSTISGALVDVKSIGALNLSSVGIASLDGSLVNIGMGTGEAAAASIATHQTLRGTQVGLPAAVPSVTEIATVVNPGDIPPSRVPVGHTTNSAFRTRRPPPATSRASDDTTDGSTSASARSFANAATAIAKRGNYVGASVLKDDPEFQAKMKDMLEKYPGLTEEELLRVMQGESNFNTNALNSDSGAVGLFQFIPGTAEMLGYTTGEIQNMSASEQLGVYDKYLETFNYSGGNLGIMQAAPAYASRGDSYEVYAPGTKAFDQNPGWVGSDGKITVGSINSYYTNQALG